MEQEFRYLPHSKPAPDGWEECGNLHDSHHGAHARLIRKSDDYANFIKQKRNVEIPTGLLSIGELPSELFDYQHAIVSWALKRGRAAIFAGTGLGKSIIQLAYAQEIVRQKNQSVLILAPLGVSIQFPDEAAKFNVSLKRAATSEDILGPGIYITNYHRLHHFDLSQFAGVILDESSILKNESGKYRNQLIEACRNVPFRLAATATPAPNDFMEFGNHAEFLGICSYTDMLAQYFIHDGSETQKWRLKGHAEDKFWQWMAGWSVVLSNPFDLGFDGSNHILPKLIQKQHTIAVDYAPNIETGLLFPVEAQSLGERNAARRSTVELRAEKAADIANNSKETFVIWCNLNGEADALKSLIPDAVEVRGSDDDQKKENILQAFGRGEIRVLITKPKICGFGMNWQHCANTIFVGLNDSFEQIYQSIRRFWRFGQTSAVTVHFIAAETEGAVVANIKRKEKQADHMRNKMLIHMRDFCQQNIAGAKRIETSYSPAMPFEKPQFLTQKG